MAFRGLSEGNRYGIVQDLYLDSIGVWRSGNGTAGDVLSIALSPPTAPPLVGRRSPPQRRRFTPQEGGGEKEGDPLNQESAPPAPLI